MKRNVLTAIFGLSLVVVVVMWLDRDLHHPEQPTEPRVVEPGQPLPMDETVKLRFVDEETGEDDVWTVTKRETSPEENLPRPLPEPDASPEPHQPVESARALQAMGLEAWKRGEIVEAKSLLEQSIEADPDDPLPRTQYGRLMLLAMDYHTALPNLERAAELRPNDPQVWLDLASYYEKKLIHERSWEALRRAKELADGRAISRDERSGFYVLDGESIYP